MMKYKVVMEFPALKAMESIKEKEFYSAEEAGEFIVKAINGKAGLCWVDPVPTFISVYIYRETESDGYQLVSLANAIELPADNEYPDYETPGAADYLLAGAASGVLP